MALFQKAVLNKYLKQQDENVVSKAYKKFTKYFQNPTIQQNIRESKEEQFQEGFLRELFVTVFGYTINPNPKYNLTTEFKNEKDAKKADGAILKDGKAIGVIELKGTDTKYLEKVRQQAFDYKANQTGCVYVITSNFEKLRFYVNNAVEFEEFDLFIIDEERFALLYLCLSKENILNNLPLKIKEASLQEEENITKKFYGDYSQFKRELFRDLVKLNMKNEAFRDELDNEDSERANKNIKHHLFKKSQKLIDRFLFIFFAEDRGLLPPNSTLKILEQWNKLKELDEVIPLYNRYKKYFNYLDQGRKGTENTSEIFAYNGGLFQPDAILDSLLISDKLLYKHTKDLSHYDFDSQVDVNILGHIFENSLNEIESVNAEIEGTDFDKQKTKRKKDGVFYTPKYITKYIVDNTVGKLCIEKKDELEIVEEEYFKSRKGRTTKKLKELQDKLEAYREWLLQLTILDPACGSGAFLNQALDFLIKEHGYIDELQTNLLGGGFIFPNIENTVLENNIFGVDLNEESIEIAKLSLWLRTAQPRRKLNNLSDNIKCGNSLIDDPKVAGDKAFKWEEEFAHIFKEKDKKAYHITTATHDSRTSQRMIDHKVRLKRDNGLRPKAEPIWLALEDEIIITKTIAEIVKEDGLNVMAYNICGDHIHLLLVCEEEEVTKIVGKIKGKTARACNIASGITVPKKSESDTTREHAPLANTRGIKQNSLWTQKFGNNPINDEKQLWNTVRYIQNNRVKHELPLHSDMDEIIKTFCCSYNHAFRRENKGGFDVVIGNPPYVQLQKMKELSSQIKRLGYKTYESTGDLYCLFYELGNELLKHKGTLGFITSNKWMRANYGKSLRKYFYENTTPYKLIDLGAGIFEGAVVDSNIIMFKKSKSHDLVIPSLNLSSAKNISDFSEFESEFIKFIPRGDSTWVLSLKKEISIIKKIEKIGTPLKDWDIIINYGIKTGYNEAFIIDETIKKQLIQDDPNSQEILKPILRGRDIQRYYPNYANLYLIETHNGYSDIPKINIEDYPSVKKYLDKHIEKISKRYDKGDTPYNLRNCAYVAAFEKPKIIYPNMTKYLPFIYDDTLNYRINDKAFILSGDYLKFLVIYLNSNISKYQIRHECAELQGGTRELRKIYMENIRVPKIESTINLKFEELADSMTSNHSKLKLKTDNFIFYLNSQFKLKKLSGKLIVWHELEFGDFIKELNKAIKKVGGEKLSKMDEMDWMEVFETKKVEAQTLKTEIDKTDAQIDAMVYELYGLSEEEIKIVEGV